MALLIRVLRRVLRFFNFGLIRHDELVRLRLDEGRMREEDVAFIEAFSSSRSLPNLLGAFPGSQSQLRQDLFVLVQHDFKRSGYFVEFGATDGVRYSNTHLLEKKFGWKGILAEPARAWHSDLLANRDCVIDTRCVWSSSGNLVEFRETYERELSTIESFSSSDGHLIARRIGKVYKVQTISLNDLLSYHGAPAEIDYLSIDTEGSEYEILEKLDFSHFSFRVITVEHNFTESRQKLFELLSKRGYRRVYEELSRFDDWYLLDV